MKTSNIIILSAICFIPLSVFITALQFRIKTDFPNWKVKGIGTLGPISTEFFFGYPPDIHSAFVTLPDTTRTVYLTAENNLFKKDFRPKFKIVRNLHPRLWTADSVGTHIAVSDSGLVVIALTRKGFIASSLLMLGVCEKIVVKGLDITIDGMAFDSLTIEADSIAEVTLMECKIQDLTIKADNKSQIELKDNNHIVSASAELRHQSILMTPDTIGSDSPISADEGSKTELSYKFKKWLKNSK